MTEAVQDAINPVWYLIIGLLVLTAIIVFATVFRPGIQGGWLAGVLSFVNSLGL